jgi:hypothetical protein
LILSGLGAIAVVLVVVAILAAKRSERQEVEALVAELRGCLLGAPLEAGENTLQRFRRLQLRALARSDTERMTAGKKIWPLSCRDATERLSKKLKEGATEPQQKSLSSLIQLLSSPEVISKDIVEPFGATLAVLDAVAPGAVPAAKDPLPPAVRSVDSLASLPSLSKKGTALGRSYTEDNPGLSLPVLIDEEGLGAPLLCVFRVSSDDASCRSLSELSAVRGHGLRMLGTSDPDAEHIVFAGRRGSEGIFVTGSKAAIDRVYSYGGYSARDGHVSALGWDEENRNMVLVQRPPGGESSRTPLRPNFRVGNFFYGSQLLWDQVLVRGVTPNEERRLFVLPLGKGATRSFELVDIGELPEPGLIRHGEEEEPHLTGCRSARATVVRVRGTGSDSLTFRLNDRFTLPVQAPTYGVLGCYGTTATVVRVAHGSGGSTRLYHSACTSAGCSHKTLKGDSLDKGSSEIRPETESDIVAVDLAGQLLVVWTAGERGGLRMRMAPPDTFDRADDVVIVDDHVWEGRYARESAVLGFRLYSREGFAVLLVSSMAGVHAFRITPDRAIQPWRVKTAG